MLLAEFGRRSARDEPSRLSSVHLARVETVGRARVRERADRVPLPDASLKPTGADPKIVLDLPFDEDTYGPSDDRARVQEFRETNDAAESVLAAELFSRDVRTTSARSSCSSTS